MFQADFHMLTIYVPMWPHPQGEKAWWPLNARTRKAVSVSNKKKESEMFKAH